MCDVCVCVYVWVKSLGLKASYLGSFWCNTSTESTRSSSGLTNTLTKERLHTEQHFHQSTMKAVSTRTALKIICSAQIHLMQAWLTHRLSEVDHVGFHGAWKPPVCGHVFVQGKHTKPKAQKQRCCMELPSGGDNYDGPGVHQLCVKQSPPPTAVQVGGLDQVGVGVDPEHQPAVGIHCQTLWTDQIYTATPKQTWACLKQQLALCGRLIRVITLVNEYLRLSSGCQCCSVDCSCRQVCPVDVVLFAVIG